MRSPNLTFNPNVLQYIQWPAGLDEVLEDLKLSNLFSLCHLASALAGGFWPPFLEVVSRVVFYEVFSNVHHVSGLRLISFLPCRTLFNFLCGKWEAGKDLPRNRAASELSSMGWGFWEQPLSQHPNAWVRIEKAPPWWQPRRVGNSPLHFFVFLCELLVCPPWKMPINLISHPENGKKASVC